MDHTLLLVDYENVGKIDLATIPAGVRVPFFFGASQKSVPTEFLKGAVKLGDRFVPIDVQGQGKNALDFHIAFYLGEYLARSPGMKCVILSKDKGFDPLLQHLVARGLQVRRVADLAQAFTAAERPDSTRNIAKVPESYEAALDRLMAMPKANRPRKRKGLIAHLYTHFSKKISEEKLQQIVDRLIDERKLSETDGALAYHI